MKGTRKKYDAKFKSKSIWNEYGKYGSQYNSKSIWNESGSTFEEIDDLLDLIEQNISFN